MAKLSIFQKEVQKFEKLFGFGTFRPMKNSVEVRVKDLDKALSHANYIISKNSISLSIGNVNCQLRSFELINK